MHLVLIETNGNQSFIFSTNKQRENIGASWLTKQLAVLVEDACSGVKEVIFLLRTSGKVILLVAGSDEDSESLAERIIGRTTMAAAEAGSGLDVTGVYLKFDPVPRGGGWTPDQQRSEALKDLHAAAAAYAANRVGPVARFAQNPFVSRCLASGLPVSGTDRARGGEAVSASSAIKRSAAGRARDERVASLSVQLKKIYRADAAGGYAEAVLPDLAKLDVWLAGDQADSETPAGDAAELAWVGVVHVDGNSMGAIFTSLEDHVKRYSPADSDSSETEIALINAGVLHPGVLVLMGDIGRRLDGVTEACYAAAVVDVIAAYESETPSEDRSAPARKAVPVVPILLGADDVTVLVAGRYALPFAESFLRHFEQFTEADQVLNELDGRGFLTGAAGVALIKRKFPFFQGYQLAEALCGSAKAAGRDDSVLDFHALYDSADARLSRIRREGSAYAELSRPFVVSARKQAGPKSWATAVSRAAAMIALADEDEPLPRTHVSALRTLLVERAAKTSGPAAAALDDRYSELLKGRHGKAAERLGQSGHAEQPHSEHTQPDLRVRWIVNPPGAGTAPQANYETAVFDALDLVEFLPKSYIKKLVVP